MKRRNCVEATWQRGLARAFVLGPLAFLLVAGAGCPSLFEGPTQRATRIRQADAGRDGALIVRTTATVVNLYAQLGGSADPVAGDASITVSDVNGNFLSGVSHGDLLLIIQMAGASIDTTTDDSAAYGAIANLGNAGRYEFVGIEGVATATGQITLACGLKHGYSRSGKTQVIRVPQYTDLTINTGASMAAPAWNGITGGIVAAHAENTVNLNGSINVSAKGFRGGATDNASRVPATGVTLYRSVTSFDGAEKGESIAGYQDEYSNGRYGRGAPANAGGGGNSYNAGGGGGANASVGVAWTGQGVMEKCATGLAWSAAWLLDDGYGGTCANSDGGGRGGYSASTSSQSPLTDAPGTCAGATDWGGNCRREVGGLGGRSLPNDPASRLFMGGGGGAGDGNDSIAGRGGRGGGLVFLIAGTVTGTGSIVANGEDGANSAFVAGRTGGDAAGGGGGGGTVVVHASTSLSGIAISVNGGQGGNQVGSGSQNEAEGPGGGGGGGYIAVSGGTTTLSATGGPAGTTDRNVMTNFQANGATAGNGGQTHGDAATFLYCGLGTSATPVTTILTKPSDPLSSATGEFTFQASEPGVTEAGTLLGEGAVTFECDLDNAGFAACASGHLVRNLTVGQHTFTVRATDVASGNVESNPPSFTWTVSWLDGGAYDSAPALDQAGSEVPFLDAKGSDGSPDTTISVDAEKLDVASDTIVANPDTRGVVSVDGSIDSVLLLDSGAVLDGRAYDGAGVDVQRADASGSQLNLDTAQLPEPNADAASLINKDASVQASDFKVHGSGFCTIASSRSPTSFPFVVLGLAALALARWRRRRWRTCACQWQRGGRQRRPRRTNPAAVRKP